ncbi:hypothetical protein O9G_003916 [Rozella allomycis CSF55]|uniref:GAF domain-containing protein n=1 Tax=Rozella allomycis (strain CSF55) TaxID=988480 RepID=A0A075AT23_ROZAC|nr:hypothetical protein O9G_003916 [Rozella allomycis CSF55]|eukprot:EPZ33413.1 hypothetical protein O9G_003916 [Rozella allomycis CSF55]
MIGGVVSEAGAQKSFIEFLTEDLLNTGFENELSIENEVYLVENILPSVVHAMQSLIVEVQRKNILKNDIEMNTIDVDMPTLKEPRFDPINWIAQFLYRKNPKYNPNVCKTEYEKQLCIISDMLKSRRAKIVEAKEERLKLEKQRRAWEREKKRLQKEKEEHEYKENVKKSWESVIKELTKGLCRAGNPFVTKNELSAVIKNIPVIEGISDDSFQKQVLEAFKEFDKINEEVLINKLNDISLSLSIAPATFEAIKEQVKATTVEIVKDFEKELEEQIFFPVIYAVPVDNHGETNGLSPGLVSLEVPVYDSVQSFKTRLREAVLSNLSGTFTKTDEQKDDTNQVDAEHEMEKFIKEFCDTEDPLFYSKQQGLVKSDSDMKEGGLLMEMEFKAFMKHVAGMESKETSKRLMRRISICLGTDKEQSMKLIEEIRTNLKRKPSETDEALKFRLEQERLAKEEAIIKRYADQEKRSNQLSEILRGIMDLVMTGAVKSNMSSTLRLLFKNLDRLLPKVTMTDEMKEVLQNVDIVDSPVELSELPLYLENLAWKISDLSVEIEDDDFNACLHDIQLYVAETTKFFRDAQEKVRNRREMENKCINEVAQLAKRVDISLPKLCEQTVLTLEKFFRSYYSSFSVYISILERPSSDTQQYQFLQRLRYIACSSKDKPILLNRYLYPGEGISFSILESGDPAFVPNVRDPSSQVKVFGLGGDDKHRVDGEFSRRGSYYGVPLISRNEPIGILGMDNIDLYENKSSVETFKEDDLKVALVNKNT